MMENRDLVGSHSERGSAKIGNQNKGKTTAETVDQRHNKNTG